MNQRIRDPLPPQYWLLRILAVNLISIPLTVGTWLVIPDKFTQTLIRLNLNHFMLIYSIYFIWTLMILIVWRLRETHSLSGDLVWIFSLTAISAFFAGTVLYFILTFPIWVTV